MNSCAGTGVREKLREGGIVYGIMAAEFFTPGFCQIASNAGAEFIIFDMEHGGVGIDVLKAQMAFARGAGVAPLVRVPGIAYQLSVGMFCCRIQELME
jgi:2-keto-3-deoxy-L-rhamnonate aldolase RhmA